MGAEGVVWYVRRRMLGNDEEIEDGDELEGDGAVCRHFDGCIGESTRGSRSQ